MSPQIQDDQTLHKGYLFSLHRLTLQMDDGRTASRDLIRHPGAALILPVLDDGRIVMGRQYRFAVDGELWELPCGTLDDGEAPESCARRELAEETGYSAGAIELLGEYWSVPGYGTEKIFAYLATDLSEGEQDLDDHEQIDIDLFSEKDVRQMARDGRIQDGKTLAALNLYWLREGA